MLEELKALTRENLEGKMVPELRNIAKELKVGSTTNLKKEGLIDKILEVVARLSGNKTETTTAHIKHGRKAGAVAGKTAVAETPVSGPGATDVILKDIEEELEEAEEAVKKIEIEKPEAEAGKKI